ncbi:tannase/feruloyl esterase family alpha/beta hydrolase [Roseibium sp. RKSG952]|uniref:tannase/feruloyl esterase family alpha/beta hydrolase n=1 Tax=Roseibium sp. RKSG952 TaxID=2529384 RepID=UPI0012BD4DC0|nr:tannase/feruloyl esterase family alpha/beta hydrolase [Roseibium sp. RKSG952]MTH95960.1 tannase/feruloyl esterase family alpha/beta hydrolase [Roseibium sp. RKSG952]
MRHYICAVAAALGLTSASALAATEQDCLELRDMGLSGGFVTSARVIEKSEALPAYCEVRATALPSISIEVRLPMEEWNGGLYQAGCGGFCGILGRADAGKSWINAMRPGLERGYATATSDGGHLGLSVVDGSWAYNNPPLERDWGWRSIGETNRVAGAMIEAFYGDPSQKAIFQGCSTGGRMAHMAAQKYPEMFQGIISGAPAMDYTGQVGIMMSWLVQTNTGPDGEQILKPGREKLVGEAVLKQCGTADGVIEDPRQCRPDLASLTCSGEASPQCLTKAELQVLDQWYSGPVNSAGEQLYPGGVPAGSEPFWWLWLIGDGEGGGRLLDAFATGFGAYMAFPQDPGPEWSPADFDFDRDPARLEIMSAVYNADNPDLTAFRDAGGKLIVWHGWADPIVTPFKTVDWYERAAEAAGGEAVLQQNVALFMIPGMDHCGILPGPGGISNASLDPLTPLESWIETGERPASILIAQ